MNHRYNYGCVLLDMRYSNYRWNMQLDQFSGPMIFFSTL